MNEHLPRPSREEREHAIEAYEEADPTTYSTLNPTGEMRDLGTAKSLKEDLHRNNRVFAHENDVYFKIEDGALQQIVSRLVKGIINVADIVEREGENGLEFYSRKMPLERVVEPTSNEEMWADIESLRMVFSDWDHDPEGGPPDINPRNIRSEYGRTNLFDFNAAEFSDKYIGSRHEHDRETCILLKKKLKAIEERVLTEEGKRFTQNLYNEAMRKDSNSVEIDFEEFYRVLGMRIGMALFDVNEQLENLSAEETI